MNAYIINNSRLRPVLFFFPFFILTLFLVFLYWQDALHCGRYIELQKDSFFIINYHLGQYPNLQFNLTQFGDAVVFLSFLSVFLFHAPKLWEFLLSGLIISVVFSCLLKSIFSVPRPAAVFDNGSFIIIGKALTGHNSSPSGHSITIFTILSVLLFSFMPKKMHLKVLYFSFIMVSGLLLAFSRVGVGAHYPLDVILGGLIGYISGLLGIFIGRKYKIWRWIGNRKYYLVFILLFGGCCILLVRRMMDNNLIVFYFSFASLAASLYKITKAYAEK